MFGVDDVHVLAVTGRDAELLTVGVETDQTVTGCPDCGGVVAIGPGRVMGTVTGSGEPVGVDLPRPAGHHVEKPGMDLPVLIAGRVDHRHGLVAAGGLRRPPDVLIDPDHVHPGQARPPAASTSVAAAVTAFIAVSQATPSRRAIADTVVLS